MIDFRAIAQISQRLSLRKPQAAALRLLADVIDLIDPSKETDVAAALAAVRLAYPEVQDFERDFPSLCFALATGVGKTRAMGAFISYLFVTGRSRNFFVLAPNLTIYEKLLADFQPQSAKYVFKGIEAFAATPPLIVNAENYEEGRGVRGGDLFGREGAIINIFNVSKINTEVRGGRKPRIKRLQEYIGDSYFNYLAELPDLVLIMDEAHRYRASAGERAINELKPILGIELTATPKTVGAKSVPFRNVILRYGLPEAMADGYVKEPAVGTRANFDPKSVDAASLELIKLEDGVHYHEHVKVQLQAYAQRMARPLVHPFMLVVAADISEAERLRALIESERFFDGRYAGRVLTVHSAKGAEESDETAAKLLAVESSGATDVVIHVNKLKEGWDVSNLFTIVPLRASASEILTEQTLGRGLRLPYGKRTGVEAVDTLTVIAHDRFNDIIARARTADGLIHKTVTIGEGGDVPAARPEIVEAPNVIEAMLRASSPAARSGASAGGDAKSGAPPFSFSAPEEIALAQTALAKVLPTFQKRVRTLADIGSSRVIKEIAAEALALQRESGGLFPTEIAPERAEAVVAELCRAFEAKTIAIPKIIQTPTEAVAFGFTPFRIEGLERWNYQPSTAALIVQTLRDERQSVIAQAEEGFIDQSPDQALVARLADYDEVDYDAHAELLYDLAGQVTARLRAYLPDEAAVTDVLQAHGKTMAGVIFDQMKRHMWKTTTGYRYSVEAAFTMLEPQTYDASAGKVLPVTKPPPRLSDIKQYVFTGLERSCYPLAKFDSDPERRLAVLLEREPTVELWMKPGPGQFRIEDADGELYVPDFVVETTTEKLILEPKRRSEVEDPEVLRKARSAIHWCHMATEHAAEPVGGKPWRYALIPDDAIQPNATLEGLLASFTRTADLETLSLSALTTAE
ncbi:MAG: DEAD/DEAH box helicase family protein [Caulobacteraceae bacterium]